MWFKAFGIRVVLALTLPPYIFHIPKKSINQNIAQESFKKIVSKCCCIFFTVGSNLSDGFYTFFVKEKKQFCLMNVVMSLQGIWPWLASGQGSCFIVHSMAHAKIPV